MSGLAVGSTFAGCRLEEVAGRGGMGVVYRATQLALNRPVALKAIAPQLAEDAAYRERFTRESRIAASIDHPNVIPVYEAGELDDTLYLIMRWVDGTDLGQRLKRDGPLAPAEAIATLRPVASALAAAHRRGLVHRDVKPANVLIARSEDDDGEHVYLTDFGIARRTDGDGATTRTGVLIGTLDYTAPERIEGGVGTPASDIYAFGCMLFETLTGRVPFDRPTELARMHAHLNDPVPALGDAVHGEHAQLDELIARTTAKDPAARIASAADVATALDRALEEVRTGPAVFRARLDRAELPTDETDLPGVGDEPTSVTVHRTGVVPSSGGAAAAPTVAPVLRPPGVDGQPRRRGSRTLAAGLVGGAVVVGVVVAIIASGGSSPAPATTSAGRSATTSTSTSISTSTAASAPIASGKVRVDGNAIALGDPSAAISASPSGVLWASVPSRSELVSVSSNGTAKRFTVRNPGLIAAGKAGVWVASAVAPSVALFTAKGGLSGPFSLPGKAIAIAADPNGSAWVADASGAVTYVGVSQREARTVRPPPQSLGVGERWLWAVNGSLYRIGLKGGQPRAFDAGPGAIDIAFDSGVWTAHSNGHVTRFNPQGSSHKVVRDQQVSTEPLTAIGALEHEPAVWAISSSAHLLYEISTSSPVVTGTVTFTSAPTHVAVTRSSVWVTTADGDLFRIVPQTP